MKKISKKIAVVLILIIFVNNFSGCTIVNLTNKMLGRDVYDDWWFPLTGEIFGDGADGFREITWWIAGGVIDIVLIICGVWGWIEHISKKNENAMLLDKHFSESETRIYPAAAENNYFSDYYLLFDRISSFPEIDSLKQTVLSLNAAEINSSIEKFNNLTEEQLTSILSIYNSLPDKKIESSMDRINSSLSDAELNNYLQYFSYLSDSELNLVIDAFINQPVFENIAYSDVRTSLNRNVM